MIKFIGNIILATLTVILVFIIIVIDEVSAFFHFVGIKIVDRIKKVL